MIIETWEQNTDALLVGFGTRNEKSGQTKTWPNDNTEHKRQLCECALPAVHLQKRSNSYCSYGYCCLVCVGRHNQIIVFRLKLIEEASPMMNQTIVRNTKISQQSSPWTPKDGAVIRAHKTRYKYYADNRTGRWPYVGGKAYIHFGKIRRIASRYLLKMSLY